MRFLIAGTGRMGEVTVSKPAVRRGGQQPGELARETFRAAGLPGSTLCGLSLPTASSATRWPKQFLRHAGLAKTGEIGDFGQIANLRRPQNEIARNRAMLE